MKRGQIAHLDRDSANRAADNLAFLCLEHHDAYDGRISQSKGFVVSEVKQYRAELYSVLRSLSRQQVIDKKGARRTKGIEDHLVALAVHEVRKLRYQLQRLRNEWDQIDSLLQQLIPYAEQYDVAVQVEILNAVHAVITSVRYQMPVKTVESVVSVVETVIPSPHIRRLLTQDMVSMLDYAASICFGITYDGIKYNKNITIVDAGAQALAWLLHIAHIHDAKSLKNSVVEYFVRLGESAQRLNDSDSSRVLSYVRANALSNEFHPLEPPPELCNKIFGRA